MFWNPVFPLQYPLSIDAIASIASSVSLLHALLAGVPQDLYVKYPEVRWQCWQSCIWQ